MFENYTYTVDLFGTWLQLRKDGIAEPTTPFTSPANAEAGMWTVATFHADSDEAVHADFWERHPAGHEVLSVLSGAIDVYLRDHGDATDPVTLRPGDAFVVPVGRWHRLSVREPGDLLAITPHTDHEDEHEPVRGTERSAAG